MVLWGTCCVLSSSFNRTAAWQACLPTNKAQLLEFFELKLLL